MEKSELYTWWMFLMKSMVNGFWEARNPHNMLDGLFIISSESVYSKLAKTSVGI